MVSPLVIIIMTNFIVPLGYTVLEDCVRLFVCVCSKTICKQQTLIGNNRRKVDSFMSILKQQSASI